MVGITADRAKIEISKTVKFTNGEGEIAEKSRPTTAIDKRVMN